MQNVNEMEIHLTRNEMYDNSSGKKHCTHRAGGIARQWKKINKRQLNDSAREMRQEKRNDEKYHAEREKKEM